MIEKQCDIVTFLQCPKRHYFGFLDCYIAGCRADLLIECDEQYKKYGCPRGYAR